MPAASLVATRPLLWFVLLCLAVSVSVVGILAARRRWGVGVLWLWIGAATTLMWAGSGRSWPFLGPSGQPLTLGSGVIAPALLLLVLLVHLEHGARDARRLLLAVAATGIVFQLCNMLAGVGGAPLAPIIGWRHIAASAAAGFAALGAMAVVYRAAVRVGRRAPASLSVPVPFVLAMLAGTAADAVVFALVSSPGAAALARLGEPAFLLSKLLSAVVVSLPSTLYLLHQMRQGRKLAVEAAGPLAIAGLGDEGPLPDVAVWRSVAETLGDGLTAESRGRVLFANAAMARIAGVADANELRNLPFERFVAADEVELHKRAQYERELGGRGAAHFEWRLLRPDGSERIIASTATPARLGGVRVTVSLHRDVTDERATSRRLAATSEAIQGIVASAAELVTSLDPAAIVPALAERALRLADARTVSFYARGADGLFVRRHAVGEAAEGPAGPVAGSVVRARAEARGERIVELTAGGRDFGVLVVAPQPGSPPFGRDRTVPLEALGAIGATALRTAALLRDLRLAERRWEALFDHVPAPVWLYDPDGLEILAVNEAAVRRYGWPREEQRAMRLDELAPSAERDAFVAGVLPLGDAGDSGPAHLARHRDREGAEFDVLVSGAAVEIEGRRLALAACVDLTLERRNQERIQTSQRLESLGRLAGGIAHDFNNILTAIQVDLTMIARQWAGDEALAAELGHLQSAAERAADLTRQVLLFSRGEEAKRRPVEIDDVVRHVERLLARSLGGTVELIVEHGAEPGLVSADSAQLQSVLLNLALNARDAMPRGGAVRVRTGRVSLDSEAAARLGVAAGPAVTLTVSDTGTGMAPEVLARAMEPFFTTKAPGQGTGLGLSIVHGVARAHQGAVEIASAPGAGTEVTLVLPALVEPEDAAQPPTAAEPGGRETILLVDDEPSVRRAGDRMLRYYGYRVILAEDGQDALERLEQLEREAQTVDLVLTDLVMPRMDARELIGVVRHRWPELPVLLSTGYDPGRLGPGGMDDFDGFIAKPYAPDELLGAVRAVLDRAR
jgi:PAS domain S-box-containing protein